MFAANSQNTFAGRLRATPWRQIALYAWLSLFVMVLAKFMAPAAVQPALGKLGLVLPLLMLAAKDFAHLPDALHRQRQARTWSARVLAFLPPELLGMFRLDRLMWRGFFQWMRRRPDTAQTTAPDGIALTYLQRGAYGTAVGIVMVSLFLELPINILVVNVMIDDPKTRVLIHVVAGIGALYSFAWVLADRWYVGEGRHVLAGDILHLRVGVRSQASIPLAAIERCERVEEAPELWRRRNKLRYADTLLVTPIDKPNCVLILKAEADVTVLHWQVRRRAPRYVLLYLDRPELLASRIKPVI